MDVREPPEYETGRIEGAVPIPLGALGERIETAVPGREARVVLYCEHGVRSLVGAEELRRLGYRDVASLAGGIQAWREEGFAVRLPAGLTERQVRRYRRHLMLPGVGVEGQRKLLASKVLVIGAGGLGCPASLYLAAAGVGRIGIVDFDLVEEANLQRQILHTTDRVGKPKTESALAALRALNPDIEVMAIDERLTSANVEGVLAPWDLVLDGTDNFPARYLINDACVLLGKPNVHGSIYRFEGQVTVLGAREGPCYRCLYPRPPAPELAPSCEAAGVLGVLPGVVGMLQAVEAIKLILGAGRPLVGRLLHYDALDARFREFRVQRDPDCAYCRPGAPFPGFIDYEGFCSRPA